MKILFLSPQPFWGGAATANIAVAKMLRDNGCEVVYNDEYYKGDSFQGLPIDHYPVHANKFKSKKLFYEYIDSIKPDAIVWISLLANSYFFDLRKLKKMGIKQMVIVHSLGLSQNTKGKIFDIITSITTGKMDNIVYVSNFTLQSWQEFIAVRISKASQNVIYNIVQSAERHSLCKDGKLRIGFVGRFSSEKQPEIFCALSYNQNYEFIAYGEGPLLEECKAKYPRVQYMGQESDQDKIYSNIDILVMTSLFENCPMVVLESKARGIPCVCPHVGGIPEIVDDGIDGRLYYPDNTNSIIEMIENVVLSYSTYSDNCVSRSKTYQPDAIVKNWHKVLKNQ